MSSNLKLIRVTNRKIRQSAEHTSSLPADYLQTPLPLLFSDAH